MRYGSGRDRCAVRSGTGAAAACPGAPADPRFRGCRAEVEAAQAAFERLGAQPDAAWAQRMLDEPRVPGGVAERTLFSATSSARPSWWKRSGTKRGATLWHGSRSAAPVFRQPRRPAASTGLRRASGLAYTQRGFASPPETTGAAAGTKRRASLRSLDRTRSWPAKPPSQVDSLPQSRARCR